MKKCTIFTSAILMAFATCLTVGCSTSEELITYNINGTWNIGVTEPGVFSFVWQITFTGGDTGGTATDTYPVGGGVGTYTITGTQISITMHYLGGLGSITYTGAITAANHMAGNWSSSGGTSGTWVASR